MLDKLCYFTLKSKKRRLTNYAPCPKQDLAVLDTEHSVVMGSDNGDEGNSANNEYNSETDSTDTVEYGRCEMPLVHYLFILFTLIRLLLSTFILSLQKVADSRQQLLYRIVLCGFLERWLTFSTIVAVAATTVNGNAVFLRVECGRTPLLHEKAAGQHIAEKILQL